MFCQTHKSVEGVLESSHLPRLNGPNPYSPFRVAPCRPCLDLDCPSQIHPIDQEGCIHDSDLNAIGALKPAPSSGLNSPSDLAVAVPFLVHVLVLALLFLLTFSFLKLISLKHSKCLMSIVYLTIVNMRLLKKEYSLVPGPINKFCVASVMKVYSPSLLFKRRLHRRVDLRAKSLELRRISQIKMCSN
jgi:hypothetical protein